MTRTTSLSFGEADRLLGEIVDEDPEFMYERPVNEDGGEGLCSYLPVNPQGRRCLIGELLHRLGVSDSELEENQFEDPHGILRYLRIEVDDHTKDFLTEVQQNQDRGNPWSRALEDARADIAEPVGG